MDTLKIIYWNIHNQTDINLLKNMISDNNPELIILSECSVCIAEQLAQQTSYHLLKPIIDKKPKIILLYNIVIPHIVLKQEYKNHLNIYKMQFPSISILLMAVHLPSKIRMDRQNQLSESFDYMQQILAIEKQESCKKTIIVGDFNMNPFDDGMIAGNGFNAVFSEQIALTDSRTICGKKYEYFFNPAWTTYGRQSYKLGTFFLKYPNHSSFHWNVYDQAIIRSSLLHEYKIDFALIDNDTYFNSTDKSFSDHSPIIVELKRRV
jgi:exonuclease III